MKKNLLFLAVVVVAVLFGSTPLVWQKQELVCANGRSCSQLPIMAVENGKQAYFNGQQIEAPYIDLASEQSKMVLGDATSHGEKHIYVDLATQTLTAYEGDQIYMQTLVSTGKWGRTPPGEYTIWVKMRSTRMSGGSGNDYYNLPNVPYVMFFYNQKIPKISGFSFHGAYWHNNFGHPMSHGCVNMRQIDAEKLYNWASASSTDTIGTKVTIF